MSDRELDFIGKNSSAAMITVGSDGLPKTARVSVGAIDGRLLSSGTASRVRTKRLRKDSRCTLFVFGADWEWLGLETTVAIVEGVDSPMLNLRLIREIEDRPTGPVSWLEGDLEESEFLDEMVRDNRLLYEFSVQRTYGEF